MFLPMSASGFWLNMALARRNLPVRPPRFHSQWSVKISEAPGMTHGLSLASAACPLRTRLGYQLTLSPD
jgi:hypothetical protein